MSSSAAGIAGVGVWTAAAGATAAGDRDDDLGRRGRVNLILELRFGGHTSARQGVAPGGTGVGE
jgi:hypothetical protein